MLDFTSYQPTAPTVRKGALIALVVTGVCVSVSLIGSTWSWLTQPAEEKKKSNKHQPKNPFRFTILNEASHKTEVALNAALCEWGPHQLPTDRKGSSLLTQISQDDHTALQHLFDQRAQQSTTYIEALASDCATDVSVEIKLTPTSGGGSNTSDLVSVQIVPASQIKVIQSRTCPAKQIKTLLFRPIAYVFQFRDQEHLGPLLVLFQAFVNMVIQSGVPGKDRVVIRLRSPGGSVDEYGLAASYVERLRRCGFYVVVCADEMACSGGYMMAAVAHRIVSAPFATIGSIGVVVQFFNAHKLMDKLLVTEKTYTAGEDKRLVSQYAECDKEAEEKLKSQLVSVHRQFQELVQQYRPTIDVSKVSTGATWTGLHARDLGLVDDIMTSDEYLHLLMPNFTVLQCDAQPPKAESVSVWTALFGEDEKEDEEVSSRGQSCATTSTLAQRLMESVLATAVRSLNTLTQQRTLLK